MIGADARADYRVGVEIEEFPGHFASHLLM